MSKIHHRVASISLLAVFLVFATAPAPAGDPPATIGMVVDGAVDVFGNIISPVQVHVFDADTLEVLGSVAFVGAGMAGDCSISADGSTGYVTQGNNTIEVFNLTVSPSAEAGIGVGTNPAFDTSLSADGKFLVICDGAEAATPPVSVVDTATGLQASSLQLTDGLGPISCNSVAVCDNNDVLVTSGQTGEVRRLTLDGSGSLTDTGDVLPTGFLGLEGPQDILCGDGGTTGVVVLRKQDIVPFEAEFFSFTTNPLTAVHSRTLTDRGLQYPGPTPPGPAELGLASAINTAGDRVYVRSRIDVNSCFTPNPSLADPFFEVCGLVEAYGYNSASAALSPSPLFKIGPVVAETGTFGVDSIAVHPDDSKLFVSEQAGFAVPAAVNVYNTSDGTLIGPLVDTAGDLTPSAAILAPTGVCLRMIGGDGGGDDGGDDDGDDAGGAVAFDYFGGKVDIDLIDGPNNDQVAFNTTFKPGADSDGIDPASEPVTIEIAGVSVTIPAGSFTLKTTKKNQFYRFNGFIGGVKVDLKIDVSAGGVYSFKGTLSNVNLDGVTNPVTVSLTIGDGTDTGSFDTTASIS